MSNVQIRGCCCGIPFGCGVLMFAGGVSFIAWQLGALSWLPSWIGVILP